MKAPIRMVKPAVLMLACVTLLAGCTDVSLQPQSSRIAVGSDSAYRALTTDAITGTHGLCASGGEACSGTRAGLATLTSNNDLVLLVSRNRSPQLYRLRGGDGAFEKIGRAGSGPGEYRVVTQLGVNEAGDVVALDIVGRRLVHFSKEGAPLSTTSIDVPIGVLEVALVAGRLTYLATDGSAVGDSAMVEILRLNEGDSEIEVAHALPLRRPVSRLGQMVAPPKTFAPKPIFALRRDGRVLFTTGEKFEIDVFDSTGAHEVRFGFDHRPRSVTEEDRERALDGSGTTVASPRMRAAMAASSRAALEGGPSHHAAITEMLVGVDGSVWVREAPREGGDSVSWIAFGATFQPVRRVLLSNTDRVLAAELDRILVTNDNTESQFLDVRWIAYREDNVR